MMTMAAPCTALWMFHSVLSTAFILEASLEAAGTASCPTSWTSSFAFFRPRPMEPPMRPRPMMVMRSIRLLL